MFAEWESGYREMLEDCVCGGAEERGLWLAQFSAASLPLWPPSRAP